MSEPRSPEVITRVLLKPSLRASGPIISCAPGPSIARGNGWNSLIGNGLRSSSTCIEGGLPAAAVSWRGPPERVSGADRGSPRATGRPAGQVRPPGQEQLPDQAGDAAERRPV